MVAFQHMQLPGAPSWLEVVIAEGDAERRGLAANALTTLIATLLPDRAVMRGPNGQPMVRGGGSHVSQSHAPGATALALAPGPVGIDIECIDANLDATALDADLFGRRDYELLCRSDAAQRNALFYRLWTLKEARLKQLGQSLASAALPPILSDERDAMRLAEEGRVGEHMSTSQPLLGGRLYCVAVCWSAHPAPSNDIAAAGLQLA